jgi:hypothetical protein
MLAAVRHLETHGYVTQLQRSNGDPVILLDGSSLFFGEQGVDIAYFSFLAPLIVAM